MARAYVVIKTSLDYLRRVGWIDGGQEGHQVGKQGGYICVYSDIVYKWGFNFLDWIFLCWSIFFPGMQSESAMQLLCVNYVK